VFLDDLIAKLNRSILGYEDVLKYLEGRGVGREDIRRFGIGFGKIISVSDDGSADFKRFKENHFDRKLAERVIFPMKDAMGRVMGLIGRSISVKGFKIFASDEAKFQGMFIGLAEALPYIYKENRVYVVEGPFDWAALVRVLPNSVSCMTAGLNEEQNWLLRMYCDRVITVFDDDAPGKAATEKAAKEFGTRSINLGFKDPSNCLETLGPVKFKSHVMQRVKEVSPF
jgi:DNA primase